MVKINSKFLENVSENLPSLDQEAIGRLSARSIYRIASAPGIEQQECAEKVEELRDRIEEMKQEIKAHRPSLIVRFFQKVKNLVGSTHQWKTHRQLLQLALVKLAFSEEEKDFWHFRESAKTGYGPAEARLGIFYAEGTGVEQNWDKAIKWYQKAADHKDLTGLMRLGKCYELGGRGVEQDLVKAFELYGEAAETGDGHALYRLGLCYEHGQGVEVDLIKAMQHYQEAADVEHNLANDALEILLQNHPELN
jgi:TPR repeat protein